MPCSHRIAYFHNEKGELLLFKQENYMDIATAPEGVLTGVHEIDIELLGGIRAGSLVFIEGNSHSGKSTLCYYLTYSALSSGLANIAYYTSENVVKGIINDMESLSLPALPYLLADRLRIYPLRLPITPREALKSGYLLHDHITNLPKKFNVAIIDTVSPFIAKISPVQKNDFFRNCKELCKASRTIILTGHPHIFEKGTFPRIKLLFDYHLELKLKVLRFQPDRPEERIIHKMRIIKLHRAEVKNRPGIRFEIKPTEGIRVVPFANFSI